MNQLEFKPFEPKKRDRFIVNLPKEFGIPTYLVKSVKFTEMYNSVSQKFEFILELYETTDVSILKNLKDKMTSQIDDYTKFNVEIILVDVVGVCLNTWKLIGCLITEVSLPTLNYNDSELLMVKIKINSDYFEIE